MRGRSSLTFRNSDSKPEGGRLVLPDQATQVEVDGPKDLGVVL